MKKKLLVIIFILITGLLLSFQVSQRDIPKEKIKEYYHSQFKELSEKLVILKKSAAQGQEEKTIQENFLQARLVYKHIELFIEYYLELDAPKFNGLSINFIEEEDPDALQEPQGFQMIESFIYPHYDTTRKEELLHYIDKLLSLAVGTGNNTNVFIPDKYILDATTEELYRIISLGISGFDSPVAQISLPEAGAALSGVQFVLQTYKEEITEKNISGYDSVMQLLDNAKQFTRKHNSFIHFNRMEFIKRFMNPVCTWLSTAKEKMGYKENLSRYTLIKKTGYLFDEKSLRLDTYMGDDTMTNARIALGKKLFYEPLLSVTGKRSCAGCHHPDKAFTDGLTTALQLDEHTALPRNTPTLWNAALQRNLFYDSRQGALDRLITEVLSNNKEMNNSAEKSIEKIIHQNEYALLYSKAYPFADTVMAGKRIVNAIAMYLRTLISYNSRFDKYIRGEKDKMNNAEIAGFNLFMGKAKCGTCHYTPLFNGSKPPAYYYQESEVLGVPATTDTVHPVLDNDPGRIIFFKKDFFNHAFKTPTLRNIALTAPYMHNGVYKTLEEVIDFYDKGGGRG
ncbi:MAG TPA: cytochrome c peroxidase, partial [Chitinophagaceae bacterium]|nr:cytochrome c peroxidase [Chitinophagaceae bacterium]